MKKKKKKKYTKYITPLVVWALLIGGIVIAGSAIFPYQGGTGTGTVPSVANVLMGTSSGTYTPVRLLGLGGHTFGLGGDSAPDAVLEIVSDSTADAFFMISTTSPSDGDVFIVTGDGDFGIGETSPDAILEITTTSANSGIDFLMLSSGAAGDGDIFIVDSGGNVGIGTSTPDYALQVHGSIVPETAGQSLGATGLEWNLLTADITFANSFIITEKGADAIAWLNPNGKEIMSLDRNGNLLVNGKFEIEDERIDELQIRVTALETRIEELETKTVEQSWWDKLVDYFK